MDSGLRDEEMSAGLGLDTGGTTEPLSGESIKIRQIQDIFPHKLRPEILEVIRNRQDEPLEQIIESMLFSESVTKEDPIDHNVYLLVEMFPNMSMQDIKEQYKKNSYNFELTLLNIIEAESSNAEEIKAEKLNKVLGVTTAKASECLKKNGDDYWKTLVDLVGEVDITAPAATNTSRVQRGKVNKEYHYDPYKLEFKQLEDMYNNAYGMKRLDHDFVVKLMVALKGDFSSLLEIATSIIENGYQGYTFPDVQVEDDAEEDQTKDTVDWTTVPKRINLPKAAQKIRSAEDAKKKATRINGRVTPLNPGHPLTPPPTAGTQKIDLHGLYVPEALSIISKAAGAWWESETYERIQDGRIDGYGRKAVFVEPLVIVTGRGLHSRDGKPVLKIKAREYLTSHGYDYNEESWGLVVVGKKN